MLHSFVSWRQEFWKVEQVRNVHVIALLLCVIILGSVSS